MQIIYKLSRNINELIYGSWYKVKVLKDKTMFTPVNIYALYKPVLLYSHITVNYRYGTILFLFKVSLIFYLQYWQTMHWCKSSEKPNKFVKYFFDLFLKIDE